MADKPEILTNRPDSNKEKGVHILGGKKEEKGVDVISQGTPPKKDEEKK